MLGRRAERSTRTHHSHARPQGQPTLSSFYMEMSRGAWGSNTSRSCRSSQSCLFQNVTSQVTHDWNWQSSSPWVLTGAASHREGWSGPPDTALSAAMALQVTKTWVQPPPGFHMDTLDKGAGARRRSTQLRRQGGEGAKGGEPRVSTSTCASVCMWWCVCAPRSIHSESWP